MKYRIFHEIVRAEKVVIMNIGNSKALDLYRF